MSVSKYKIIIDNNKDNIDNNKEEINDDDIDIKTSQSRVRSASAPRPIQIEIIPTKSPTLSSNLKSEVPNILLTENNQMTSNDYENTNRVKPKARSLSAFRSNRTIESLNNLNSKSPEMTEKESNQIVDQQRFPPSNQSSRSRILDREMNDMDISNRSSKSRMDNSASKGDHLLASSMPMSMPLNRHMPYSLKPYKYSM